MTNTTPPAKHEKKVSTATVKRPQRGRRGTVADRQLTPENASPAKGTQDIGLATPTTEGLAAPEAQQLALEAAQASRQALLGHRRNAGPEFAVNAPDMAIPRKGATTPTAKQPLQSARGEGRGAFGLSEQIPSALKTVTRAQQNDGAAGTRGMNEQSQEVSKILLSIFNER